MNHQAPTWMNFKSIFKARYGISVVDDRQTCAAELMNTSFQPDESFNSFVDRFNDLRRRAFDQLPQPFLLMSRLMLILPSPLRSQVNIIRQSKGLTSITADMVIQIAQELLASMTPSEVNAAMGYTAQATPTPPSSKAAAAPTATTIPIEHGYASKVAKPAPSGNRFTPHGSSSNMYTSPSRGQKYCTYYKSRVHNTSECNAYAAAAALSSASTSSERGGNSPCDNCGAPNYIEGHVCNTANPTGNPPSAPEHCFRMMKINDNEGRVPRSLATQPQLRLRPTCLSPTLRSIALSTGLRNITLAIVEPLLSISNLLLANCTLALTWSFLHHRPQMACPLLVFKPPMSLLSLSISSLTIRLATRWILTPSSLLTHKDKTSRYMYGVLYSSCTFSICAPQFAKYLASPVHFVC